MSVRRKLLEEIAQACESLADKAKATHWGDVAMYIALEKGCQIFIECLQKDVGDSVSFTANCDINVTQINSSTGQEIQTVSTVQHFIFYKPDKDIEIERARVAHELGHCLLHWPLGVRKKMVEKEGSVYIVNFTKKDEDEADAFMSLCLNGLFSMGVPKLPPKQVVDEAYDNLKRYRDKGFLQSEQ